MMHIFTNNLTLNLPLFVKKIDIMDIVLLLNVPLILTPIDDIRERLLKLPLTVPLILSSTYADHRRIDEVWRRKDELNHLFFDR